MFFAYPNLVWVLYVGVLSLLILRKNTLVDRYIGSLGIVFAVAGFFVPTEAIVQFCRIIFP